MAVKLRLRREGTKRQAHYRVVAADSRAPRDGAFLEILGDYHPMEDPSGIRIDAERALHWLRSGARPTDAVQQLLYISGVWEEFRPGTTPDHVTIQEPDEPEEVAGGEQATADEGAPDEEPDEQPREEPDEGATAGVDQPGVETGDGTGEESGDETGGEAGDETEDRETA